MKLNFNREQIGRFCQPRGIARLELFGSALGDDFRADSDVDLLPTLRIDAMRATMLVREDPRVSRPDKRAIATRYKSSSTTAARRRRWK